MKEKKRIRNYHFKDSELIFKCQLGIEFIKRDIEHFNLYGKTENDLLDLEQKIAAFMDIHQRH